MRPPLRHESTRYEASTHDADSQTAFIADAAALHGAGPNRGDPDPRDIYDPAEAHEAIREVFELIATRVAPDGGLLAQDRADLLWGFVHSLDYQVRRHSNDFDDLRPDLKAAVESEGAPFVSDDAILALTDEAHKLAHRMEAFEALRNTAADLYREQTGETWISTARTTTSVFSAHDAPSINMMDFKVAGAWLRRNQGTRIAVTAGPSPVEPATVNAALDRLKEQHPDLLLVHGGHDRGIDPVVADWARANRVRTSVYRPDYQGQNDTRALHRRNDRIIRDRIQGVVSFSDSPTGFSADLVARAQRSGVPVTRIASAPSTAPGRSAPAPVAAGYRFPPGAMRPDVPRPPERDAAPQTAGSAPAPASDPDRLPGEHDPDDAAIAVSEMIGILGERVAQDGFQLADRRESILWGFVNVINRQRDRLDRLVRDAQDGPDAEAPDIERRRDAFDSLFEIARDSYHAETGQPWEHRGSRFAAPRRNETAARHELRSLVERMDRTKHAANHVEGTLVAATGYDIPGGRPGEDHYAEVFDTLNAMRRKHPDMILVHGAHSRGYDRIAASWAKTNRVPQLTFPPNWNRYQRAQAPYRRNEEMMRDFPIAELVVFGEGGSGYAAHLADLAETGKRIPVHYAARAGAHQLSDGAAAARPAQQTGEALRTTLRETWRELHAAAGRNVALMPYQEGFADYHRRIVDILEADAESPDLIDGLNRLHRTFSRETRRMAVARGLGQVLNELVRDHEEMQAWQQRRPDRDPWDPREETPARERWLRNRDQALHTWRSCAADDGMQPHLGRPEHERIADRIRDIERIHLDRYAAATARLEELKGPEGTLPDRMVHVPGMDSFLPYLQGSIRLCRIEPELAERLNADHHQLAPAMERRADAAGLQAALAALAEDRDGMAAATGRDGDDPDDRDLRRRGDDWLKLRDDAVRLWQSCHEDPAGAIHLERHDYPEMQARMGVLLGLHADAFEGATRSIGAALEDSGDRPHLIPFRSDFASLRRDLDGAAALCRSDPAFRDAAAALRDWLVEARATFASLPYFDIDRATPGIDRDSDAARAAADQYDGPAFDGLRARLPDVMARWRAAASNPVTPDLPAGIAPPTPAPAGPATRPVPSPAPGPDLPGFRTPIDGALHDFFIDPGAADEPRHADIARRYRALHDRTSGQPELLPHAEGFRDFRERLDLAVGRPDDDMQPGYRERLSRLSSMLDAASDRSSRVNDLHDHVAGHLEKLREISDACVRDGRVLSEGDGYRDWLAEARDAVAIADRYAANPLLRPHLERMAAPLDALKTALPGPRPEAATTVVPIDPGSPVVTRDADQLRAWQRKQIPWRFRDLMERTGNHIDLFPYQHDYDSFRGLVREALKTQDARTQFGDRLQGLDRQLSAAEQRKDAVGDLLHRAGVFREQAATLDAWAARTPDQCIRDHHLFDRWRRKADAFQAELRTIGRNPAMQLHLDHSPVVKRSLEQSSALLGESRFQDAGETVRDQAVQAAVSRTTTQRQSAGISR